MQTSLFPSSFEYLRHVAGRRGADEESQTNALAWSTLPFAARLYAAGVIIGGVLLMVNFFPTTIPSAPSFAALVALSCITSAWKVNLPLHTSSGSTLSVSCAADLMALMLLGPQQAMVVAVAGAWTQCTFNVRRPYPSYRTIFSMAAEAVTMQATGLVYLWLQGAPGLLHMASLPKALVGMSATYFFVNTGLLAGAVALSTRQSAWKVWHDSFLWSGPSFMVAGAAGAIGAVVIERDDHWMAILMLAPVYLTYRTYQVFLGRIEDQRRHVEETQKLHSETIAALLQARRAERALADEKERLAVTLRSIGDGVIATDLDGNVLSINNVAETLTGWTQEDAAGKPFGTVFRSFDPETRERRQNLVATVAWNAGQPSVTHSTVLVARDLSERPIEEISAPLRDAAGRTIGMVVAFRDITDALKMREERAKASKLDSLGLLAGGIAHDFNNILMAIMGNVSMARVTMPSGPSMRALDEAQQACLRARQLTWQLLTFSRGGAPVKKTTAIPRILKESAGLALRGSNASCTFDIAPEIWAVSADEGQLVQVFTNMMINARQAMPQGGAIRIRAENVVEPDGPGPRVGSVDAGRSVRITVTDEGIGIPEENLGRIFDPYFTTKQKGSGLGLATSYSIIKNHGGSVSVESKPGQGTTLRVTLPASTSSELPLEPPTRVAPRTGGGPGRILVMDDEASIRRLAANMLTFLGHDVAVVDNGTTAVEQYTHALMTGEPFDAVILDLIVPGGAGAREAMELLSEVDPAVNAIVVSGYAQDSAMTEYRDYGFKGAISKPFTLEELNTALHSVMGTASWRVH
jgi:PAS domain S-box-containing protein